MQMENWQKLQAENKEPTEGEKKPFNLIIFFVKYISANIF